VVSSLTTSNAQAGRNPHAPLGLRRPYPSQAPSTAPPAPRRWLGIACVAVPRIRPHGVRNATVRTFTTGC
jgi:hypothetical protein